MKPVYVKDSTYINFKEEANDKDHLNLRLVIMYEFQNIKTFLLKDIHQIGQKKFL